MTAEIRLALIQDWTCFLDVREVSAGKWLKC